MIGALAALAAASSPLSATYPATVDRDGVAAWLPRATGLGANQVIAVTASSAVAIVTQARAPDGRVEVLLRALPLTPEATARGGVLAWQMRVEIDCRASAIRPGGTMGYDSQLAEGDGVALAPAETAWRPPKPGTPLENAMLAVCQRDFEPPLLAAGQRLAQPGPTPAAAPAPAPAAAPPAPETLLASLRPSLPAPFFAPNTTVRATASPTPSSRGVAAVQLVSSPNETDTRQALASLQGRFAELQGMQTRIEPAQVRGRTVYRGVVTGFSSRDQARAFCDTLKRSGGDCLAR